MRDALGDAKVLFHVGYPKAASTFLQNTLFSGAHPEINPVPVMNRRKITKYDKAGFDLLFDNRPERRESYHPLSFEPLPLTDYLIDASRRSHDAVHVLSNEDWCGHPFSGGVMGLEVLRRIRLVAPRAKILFVVREQRSMLLSVYAHFLVRSHGSAQPKTFLHAPLSAQVPGHHPQFYCYSRLIAQYIRAFGSQNVLTIPLELLIRDPDSFANAICRFVGVAEKGAQRSNNTNRRDYSEYSVLRRNRFLNFLGRPTAANGYSGLDLLRLRNAIVRVLALTHTASRVDELLKRDLAIFSEHLAGPVSEDNQKLQEMIDYDLDELGYLLPASTSWRMKS